MPVSPLTPPEAFLGYDPDRPPIGANVDPELLGQHREDFSWLSLHEEQWVREVGRGDCPRFIHLGQLETEAKVNDFYRQRRTPFGNLAPRPDNNHPPETGDPWFQVSQFCHPGPLPKWQRLPGHLIPSGPQLTLTSAPTRQLLVVPIWCAFRSLGSVFNLFRDRNPTMSPTSGFYNHERRRAHCRDRRTLSMVFWVPDVHRSWMTWSDSCSTLLRLRACSTTMSRLVQASEASCGDALATLCVGLWLEKVALDVGEYESHLWTSFRRDDPQMVRSLWEYERHRHGGGMLWDQHDRGLGFPKYEDPGGIGYELLRRPNKWARAYLRLPWAGNRPQAGGTSAQSSQPRTPTELTNNRPCRGCTNAGQERPAPTTYAYRTDHVGSRPSAFLPTGTRAPQPQMEERNGADDDDLPTLDELLVAAYEGAERELRMNHRRLHEELAAAEQIRVGGEFPLQRIEPEQEELRVDSEDERMMLQGEMFWEVMAENPYNLPGYSP